MMAEALSSERERWPLWFPVGAGAGVAVYFALPFEPTLISGLSLLVFGLALGLVGLGRFRQGRGGGSFIILALILAAPALGFTAAKLHSARIASPVIQHRMGPLMLEGHISAIEPGLKGPRVTIDNPVISRLAPEDTPRRVRVRVRPSLARGAAEKIRVGARVRMFAILLPPPGPAVPGGFDFARAAWFKVIGAVGFAVGTPATVSLTDSPPEQGLAADFRNAVGQTRRTLFIRITDALPGQAGGIAAALMTGERGRISEPIMEAMRVAGLAHLLAISGLHIGLVTGILFFGVRALLALWSGVALRWPIKKWAAGAALFGAFVYMLLTGATVPTQRAFLMVALVLTAVMLDRSALSMRLVAFAAIIVLLLAPDSITGPSFQMSFAAVAALIAAFEVARGPLNRLRGEGGIGRRVFVYLAGVMLTTLVAGLATAPFALYHFGRLAVFGLAANLGAVPVTAFWIMPFATLAYILMPLGLESLALVPMGWGIDAVIAIAEAITASPGASFLVPTMPLWGLALITLGGLWLVLWRQRWRLAGIAAIIAGLLSFFAAAPPDFLISGDGKSFAVRSPDGALIFAGKKGSRFQRDIWLRRSGISTDSITTLRSKRKSPLRQSSGERHAVLRCDTLGCMARVRGHAVSLIHDLGAVREDCARAHLVIALIGLHRIPCREPARVITRAELRRKGTHAIWIDERGTIRVETVADGRGVRPWSNRGARLR